MPKLIAKYLRQFRWVDLPLNLAVVAIYLLFAKIGLILALKSPAITIFWPAGGFALAVLLLGGLRAGQRKTAVLQLMLFGQALWSAGHGIGQYADQMAKSDLIDFWMFGFTMAVGGMAMAVIMAENRRSEQLRRDSEQLLSESQHLAHIGGWSWAENNEMVRCTNKTYRIFGVTPDTFQPTMTNFMKLIHPDDQKKLQQWIRSCLDGEQP